MNSSRRSDLTSKPSTTGIDVMAPADGEPVLRMQSIDVVRGTVMLLMAIDHVRVYSGIPAGGPTLGIFLTRWVTHFCAPAFAFLAGTSAFLYGRKLAGRQALATFLSTRGILLVLLELTVIRLAWTFNFNYRQFTLAGVIWMLGWCMVLLAGLTRVFPPKAVGAIGLAIIFCQQLFRFPPLLLPAQFQNSVRWLWEFIYPTGMESHSGITVLYVLVPWIGVMAAGYGFGLIIARPRAERRRFCLTIGLSATAAFVVIASLNVFLNPAPANAPLPALLRLLNQQKYPASQLFLSMTLGPIITLLPLVEHARGWLVNALATMGRVPMFYYLLHIPLIHVAALFVTLFREGQMHPEWYATAPFTFLPPAHRWSLPLLYAVWTIVVAILFLLCRWFAAVKARGRSGWLRYI